MEPHSAAMLSMRKVPYQPISMEPICCDSAMSRSPPNWPPGKT